MYTNCIKLKTIGNCVERKRNCIGSSCHLKGSRTIIQKLEELITERQLNDKIELNGSFCMGECSNGVCVKINDELFSVSPETVNTFFENEVLRRL